MGAATASISPASYAVKAIGAGTSTVDIAPKNASKDDAIKNAKKLLNHAKNILKQLEGEETSKPSSGSASAAKGVLQPPAGGSGNQVHGVVMNNEPFKREDMKHFQKPPINPMVDASGKKITQEKWDSMNDWQKHDAYTHTRAANETLAQQGKPPISDAMIADANTPNDSGVAMRMQNLVEGKGKDGLDVPMNDLSGPVDVNNDRITPEMHAQKIAELKAEGIVPNFTNDPRVENDVDRNNLLEALGNKSRRGESVEGPAGTDWSGFSPNGTLRGDMDKGISSKSFADMDPQIKQALQHGNQGLVMPEGMPEAIQEKLKGEAKEGRELFRKLQRQGHIPEEIGFNPQNANNGKGVDARAVNVAAKAPMVLNVGPQDHGNAAAGAAKEGLFFDDVNKLMNVKDPFAQVDRDTGVGGQNFAQPQQIRNANLVKHVGPEKNVPMIKKNAKNVQLGVNDQPKGAVFLGKQKGPNQGGVSGRCAVMAPPQMRLPASQNDTPRVSFQCGVGRDDPRTNKGLFERIRTDFKDVEVNPGTKGLTNAQINTSIKAGKWEKIQIPADDIHPDTFKLRKNSYNINNNKTAKVSVFKDDSGLIDGVPAMKKQSITFGGQTRSYAVLDDNVRYVPQVVQATEPGRNRPKPVVAHGEVISDNQVTRSMASKNININDAIVLDA